MPYTHINKDLCPNQVKAAVEIFLSEKDIRLTQLLRKQQNFNLII